MNCYFRLHGGWIFLRMFFLSGVISYIIKIIPSHHVTNTRTPCIFVFSARPNQPVANEKTDRIKARQHSTVLVVVILMSPRSKPTCVIRHKTGESSALNCHKLVAAHMKVAQ